LLWLLLFLALFQQPPHDAGDRLPEGIQGFTVVYAIHLWPSMMAWRAALLGPVAYLTNDGLGFIIVQPANWAPCLAKRSVAPL
jgi:hypothetical protein